ncbi:TetR/AcrR family transcriptional regulator [Weissella confusa]|uniref:TetR/AcrR family transcriptional regulator n=1 Tax=Weissella confusa TaxID=1583 RepID=UPI003BF914B9
MVTFYKYFDSKEALIGTIAAEQLNTLFDQIMAITNQTDLRFIEKIKAFAQLSQQKQQEIANTFGDEMMQLLEKDDSAVRAVAESRRDEFFEAIIEQGRDEGFFTTNVSTTAIRMYIDMFVTYPNVQASLASNSDLTRRELDAQLEELFFFGLMGSVDAAHRDQLNEIRKQQKG